MADTQTLDRDPPSQGDGGAFGAFRHRDYLYFIAALGVSGGAGIARDVTVGFLVYTSTGSAQMLGYLAVARLLPVLVVPFIGGVAADRMPRVRLLQALEVFRFAIAIVAASLILAGMVDPWTFFALALLAGSVSAVARLVPPAVMPEVVPRRDLLNANVLSGVLVFAFGVVFGPLSGLLTARELPWAPFIFATLGSLAVIWLFSRMRAGYTAPRPAPPGPLARDVADGLRAVMRDRVVAMLLVLLTVAASGLFVGLLRYPIVAGELLGQILLFATLGTAVATLTLAFVGDVRWKGHVLLYAMAVIAGALLLGALSDPGALRYLAALIASAAVVVAGAVATTLLQLRVPNHLRGRIFAVGVSAGAVISLVVQWLGPWGALPVTPLLLGGAVLTAGATLLAWLAVPELREIDAHAD